MISIACSVGVASSKGHSEVHSSVRLIIDNHIDYFCDSSSVRYSDEFSFFVRNSKDFPCKDSAY